MTFRIGDLVWAKMKGFPPWPGLVSEPPVGLEEDNLLSKSDLKSQCIYFFGTHDYAFIEESQLKDYLLHKDKMTKLSKNAKFRKACSEIDEHLKKQPMKNEDTEKTEAEGEKVENVEKIESEAKPSMIGGGLCILYPRIKLHKLNGIEDFLPIPVIPKKDIEEKRALTSPEKATKKRKHSTFSDPDTTTPLDAMCQPSLTKEQIPKDEISINSSEELTGEEEEEEEDGDDSNSSNVYDDTSDISSGAEVPSFKIGFIGLGVMGRTIVRRLLQNGHDMIVFNRSPDKFADFLNSGITIAASPAEVVMNASLVFCCVANGMAAKEVLFCEGGVMNFLTPEKSFIDLSSSDVQSSLDMSEAVYSMGSRYLEVRLHGSKQEAEEGSLVCLTAGDESLHNDCQFFFECCSKKSMFMGEVGNASRIHLVLQSVAGIALAGLAECLALADRAGLDQNDLLNILKISQINCPLIVDKATSMVNGDFSTKMALRNMQSDLQGAIAIGEELEQPTPVTATANEIYKHAKKIGYSGHDVAAVYLGSKF